MICCSGLPGCWPLPSYDDHIPNHKYIEHANSEENEDVVPSLFCLEDRGVSFRTHTSLDKEFDHSDPT